MEKLTKKIIVFILPIVFALLSLSTQRVFATQPPSCSPPDLNSADAWFETEPSFDPNTIPNIIEIIQIDARYKGEKKSYELFNNNSEPFYIVRKNSTEKNFPNSDVPQNYEPLYKLTAERDRIYSWWEYNNTWYVMGFLGRDHGVPFNDKTYTLEGKSRQVYQDNRPNNVQIPEPQDFKILGFYKGTSVEIRGTLHYSLNDKYDPQAFAKLYANYEKCRWDILPPPLKAIKIILNIISIIAIFILILEVVKGIRSVGDKAKAKSARHTIIKGIIGLILVFLAYFIIQLVAGLFGLF